MPVKGDRFFCWLRHSFLFCQWTLTIMLLLFLFEGGGKNCRNSKWVVLCFFVHPFWIMQIFWPQSCKMLAAPRSVVLGCFQGHSTPSALFWMWLRPQLKTTVCAALAGLGASQMVLLPLDETALNACCPASLRRAVPRVHVPSALRLSNQPNTVLCCVTVPDLVLPTLLKTSGWDSSTMSCFLGGA